MFTLAVEFLTGRYVATAYNDRDRAEWPPHPARVYSTLVATHFDDPRPEERRALEWLEQQGPPSLAVSEASERQLHTVFVPVNDKAADPDRRVRQPRTFPSVTPAQPRVELTWPHANASPDISAALDRLAARVVRLGHSSSLVSVRVANRAVETNWRPDDAGETRLRVVGPRQLADLEQRFQVHRETEPRVMPAILRVYTNRPARRATEVPGSIFSDEWLVLHRVDGPRLPSVSAVGLARAIRKILLSFAAEPIPEVLSGHRVDGTRSETAHLAVVPLPFVGSRQADGALLGIALVLPRDIDEADRRAVFRAVAAWEGTQRTDMEETPRLPVHLGAAGVMFVSRIDELTEPRTTLRPWTWCGPARRWASATPVALDRNPGNLKSRDPRQLAQAVTGAEGAVRVGCQRLGLPSPTAITILPAAPIPGSAKASHFPPFPGKDERVQRVLTHVAIEFAERVRGPILLGAGRYVGLGLMRPVDHD
jgi:CRISPR-associated protein Csb2